MQHRAMHRLATTEVALEHTQAGLGTQPFAGIRVVDCTHVLAGPFCTYQLAVLGAEVIKVEHPDEPDQVRETGTDAALNAARMGTNFLTQAANKQSLTLDLKQPAGQEVLRRLVARADVFVENFRPGALEALGLGAAALRAINPGLIYCAITGFGQEGPKRGHTAYDGIIQAASGLMSVSGTPEVTPLKVGAPVVDYASGAMAAFAIASALFQRTRNGGLGQVIDMAMLDAALMLLGSTVTGYQANGTVLSVPRGNDFVSANGCCYETADGLLMIAALNPRQHARLWTLAGRPDIAARARPAEVAAQEAEMKPVLTRLFATRTAAEWEELLAEAGVPAARVRSLPEALAMPQVLQRPALLQPIDAPLAERPPMKVPGAPFSYEHGGPRVTTPPPRMGQHTDAILENLGYDAAAIGALRSANVI